MTWIKPSFLWMMYRCGWATKPGQERVLAVEITRAGFEWALARACLSHYDPCMHGDPRAWSQQLKISPVRIQWGPERSLRLAALPHRSLQVGLSGDAVDRYVDEWTVALTDVTGTVRGIHELLRAGDEHAATTMLPTERPYPPPMQITANLAASPVERSTAAAHDRPAAAPPVSRHYSGCAPSGWTSCGSTTTSVTTTRSGR
jgi:hypothetical protein